MDDIINLAGRDRNPIDEQRYREALTKAGISFADVGGKTNVEGFGLGGNSAMDQARQFFSPQSIASRQALASQEKKQQDLFASQRAEQDDFLGRFKSTIGTFESLTDASNRITGDIGLDKARQAALELTTTLKNLPNAITNTGRAASVNQNRLTRAIGERASALQPVVSDVSGQVQAGEASLNNQLGLLQADQNRQLIPFQTQASMMSEQLARETSLFSQDKENQFNMILENMRNKNSITLAELNQANALAQMKAQYELAKEYGAGQSDQGYLTLGEGQTVFDPTTGQAVYTAPKTYKPNNITTMGNTDYYNDTSSNRYSIVP